MAKTEVQICEQCGQRVIWAPLSEYAPPDRGEWVTDTTTPLAVCKGARRTFGGHVVRSAASLDS